MHAGPLKSAFEVRMSEAKRGKGRGGRPAALVEGGKSTQYYSCEACPAKMMSFHLKKQSKHPLALHLFQDSITEYIRTLQFDYTYGFP